jgi:hypothetical protein
MEHPKHFYIKQKSMISRHSKNLNVSKKRIIPCTNCWRIYKIKTKLSSLPINSDKMEQLTNDNSALGVEMGRKFGPLKIGRE